MKLKNATTAEQHIAIIDDTNGKSFSNAIPDAEKMYFKTIDTTIDAAKKIYQQLGFTGVLYFPPDSSFSIYMNKPVQYFSNTQLGISMQADLDVRVSAAVRKFRLNKLSSEFSSDQIEAMEKPVTIEPIILGEAGKEEQGYAGAAAAVGYVMGIFLYMILLIYGAMVMRGVMEEKTSRIAEVMISSVKPFQLMMGKIIGIALVGLTQFFLWFLMIVTAYISIRIFAGAPSSGDISAAAGSMDAGDKQAMMKELILKVGSLNWSLIITSFIFFFLSGYLLYASLFAAVGSATGEDAGDQSLKFIVTIPIAISFIIMINVMEQPNSMLAVVSSFIPFTAPIIMCARIPFGVPAWQIILSMISVVGGFLFTTWFAGKIYRTGILMYGKKTTLKEMMKWLRYKN